MGGPPKDWIPLSFLSLILLSGWASSNLSITIQLSIHTEVSARGFLLQKVVILSICLQVSLVWGVAFVLLSYFSDRSKKICRFFSLFRFLLFTNMEWQLLSFLHARPETGSPLKTTHTPKLFLHFQASLLFASILIDTVGICDVKELQLILFFCQMPWGWGIFHQVCSDSKEIKTCSVIGIFSR